MKKIELIESDNDFVVSDNLFANEEQTITDSANRFKKKSTSPFFAYLVSGTLIFSTPPEGSALVSSSIVETIENFDSFLNNYNSEIESPIFEFLENVNCISQNVTYSKNDIVKEILSFKALNNNWDGYSSYPLEIESATNAIMLIDLIGETLFSSISEFYPNPHGTISFDWSNKSGETLSLEVGNETMSYYLDLASQETLYINNVNINVEEAERISEKIRLL